MTKIDFSSRIPTFLEGSKSNEIDYAVRLA